MSKEGQQFIPGDAKGSETDASSKDPATTQLAKASGNELVKMADGSTLNNSSLSSNYLHLFSGLFAIDEYNRLLFDPQFVNVLDYKPDKVVDLSKTLPATEAGEESTSTSTSTTPIASDQALSQNNYSPHLVDFNNTLGSVSVGIETRPVATNFSNTFDTSGLVASNLVSFTPPGLDNSFFSTIGLSFTGFTSALTGAQVSMQETNAPLSTSGTLVNSAGTFIPQADVSGANGVFNLASNGVWTYATNTPLNALNIGQSVSDTFNVESSDGRTTTVQVTVTGTNDEAILSSETIALNQTTDILQASGTITIVDPDNPETFVPQTDVVGTNGRFTIDENGNWNYVANESFISLNEGDSVSDIFTVTSSDGSTTTVQVTINGTNDAATLSSESASLSETNSPLSASGTINISDPDSPETFIAQSDVSGSHGTFSIDANGNWSFVANNAFDNLNVGDSASDTFTVASSDGTTTTVQITINGTNDAATLSSATINILETDAAPSTSGTLLISDPDNPDVFLAQTDIAGTNGTFNIDANGNWSYVANSAFDSLNVGDSVSDTFTVASLDGTTTTVQVTINGTNDAATLSSETVSLSETDAALSTSGSLTISDPDNLDTFVAQTNVAGTNGTFSIDANGNWTYDANSAFDNLNVGDSVSDTFTVASLDGTTTTVQVTINGTNDAATLSSETVSLSETDAALSTSGSLTISDPDNPDTFVAQTNVAGTNGTFSIDANGNWTYDANSAFDSLNVGDSVSDTFTVASLDGTTTTVQVTINGTNDAATLSSETVSLSETDAALSTSGSLTISDPDNPDTFVAQTNVAGTNGTFSIDANGNWTYDANSAFDSLNVGDSVSDTFTVASLDGTTTTVQVTINGTNDAATLSSETVSLSETDAALSTSGSLTISDPDNPDTFVAQTNVAGTNGTFSIDANGNWTYDANSAFDSLNVGDSVSDTFTVASLDGTTTTVQVTINGTNDAATLSSETVSLSETDAALSTSGSLTISDPDNPDTFVAQTNVAGTNGTFSIDANGNWTYDANSAFDSLNVGDSVSDTFTVASLDGTTTTVQVTINGTNDAATLSSETVSLSETDAALSTSGSLTISDPDNPDTFVAQTNVAGTNGTFSIDVNGNWTYDANSAFDSLNVGDSVSDTFTVASLDGTTTTVQVTINGTNDAATLSSETVSLSETDAALSTSGSLTISDPDNPDTFVAQTNVAGTNGTFSIDANGNWTYDANSAFDSLNVGDSVSDTFTVASLDGTTTTVQVTINGTNDAATLSSETVSLSETDAALSTSGSLTISDPDNPDTFVAQTNVAGTNGTFSIDANGNWTYDANSAFDSLNVGDSVSDTFTVASLDGTTTTVQVTINGTNDAATLSSETVSLSETDAALSTSGSLTISDPDNLDTFVAQTNVAGTNGTFSIDTNGNWTYDANSAFDSLNVGDSVSDTFTVASLDGTTTTVQVTINGTNDAATLSSETVSLSETDAALSTSGTLTISDPDNPDTFVAQTNVAGTNGTFSIDANGNWTYDANSAFDSLNVGDSVSDTFTVASLDGTTTTVQVTINGTNDAATLSSETVSLSETDAALSTSGSLTISDPDNPDTFVAQTNVAGTNGTFSIDANGNWTYDANSAFDNLNVGDSVSDTFTVASLDGTTTTVQVTINGTNDAATLSSETVSLSETDAALSTSGTLTISDPDNLDTFVAQTNVAGTNGTFSIDTNGNWTYDANSAFDSLNVGDSVSDTFTVASLDGTTTTVQVTINGTNDAATLSSETVSLSETDAALSTSGTLTISDPDNPDTFVVQTNVAGTNGTFSIDANGNWTYDANSAFDSLNVGDSVSDTFTVASLDGTTTTVQVTINGTNDAATLSSETVSLSETDAALSTSGSLTISDPDNLDTFVAQTNVAGTNGTFSIDTNGNWTYDANSAFDSLNVGDSVSDTFTVASLDGTTTTVQVTINGTNDAATLSSETVSLSETDAALSTSGTLTISDPDNLDTFVAQTNVAGTNGTFSIDTNGNWTYDANSAFDSLNVGDSVSDTFTVASLDGTTTTVQVTINGTNDAATLSSETVSLSETDAALSTSGSLTISDPDNPDTFVAQTNVAGTNGTFSIDANGNWTYDANSAFDSLNVGDSVSDTFTVASLDGTTTTVQVTINGTNDAATLSSETVSLSETDAALSTSGSLTISDPDNPDTFVAQTNVAGTNGTFSINANGNWTYDANSAFDNLNVGDSVSDTFTVASLDGTTTTVQVTINGTNDAATLSSETVSLSETDAALSTSGSLTISDPDNLDTFVAQTNVAGTNGTFSIDTNGNWTYDANSAFDSLNVGDSVSDTFTVASLDGTTTTVQVTINGTNDAATLSSETVSLSETDAALSTSGSLTISDPDNPDTFVAQTNVAGTNGTFSIDANGNWTYDANSAFDSLNVGDSVSDTFTVASLDGTTTTVQVTINGTNDAPVTSVDVAGSVTEGGILNNNFDLLLNDSDVDSANLSVSQFAQDGSGTGATSANGSNTITTSLGGTVLMNTDGTFTYTAPTSADHSLSDTIVDSFYYKASDSSAESDWTQVSINVGDTAPTAADDADTVTQGGHVYGNVITGLGGDGTGADTLGEDVTELTSVVYDGVTYDNFVNGSLTINADNGVLVVNQDGSYHYQSTQNAGTPLSAGGSNSMSSWTNAGIDILGYSMGTPVFGTDYNVSINNKGLYIDSPGGDDKRRQLDSTSTTDTETIVLDMNAEYASLDLTLKGVNSNDQMQWKTYDENQNLLDSGTINNTSNGSGSHKEATFTIEPGQPFHYIAIQGTDSNDEFTIWSIDNAQPAVSGTDAFTYTITDSDNDVSTAELTVSHEEADGLTANVEINSVDESGLASGSDPNAADITASGNLLANDANVGQSTSITQVSFGGVTAQPVNGVISISTLLGVLLVYTEAANGYDAGDYIYTLESASDSNSETITYQITNSTTGDISESALIINIADDPTAGISIEAVNLAETDSALSTGGTLTDANNNPETFVAQSNVAGSNGIFNIDANGNWTYDANSAFDNLNVGDSISDSFQAVSADGETTVSVQVTIEGTNDAATLSSQSVALAETDAALSTSGSLSISDPDNPETFVEQSNVAGNNGTFSIDANGDWTYVANSAFDSLNIGDSVSDTFNVTSSDGTTSSVQVTINGTNDSASLSSASVNLTETDAALSTSGSLTLSDPDNQDTAFVAQSNVAGNNGTFSIDANGNWTYDANSAFDNLNLGDSVSDTFNVTSTDGSTTTVQVTINGSNDSATLSSETVSLSETNAALSTSGTLTISDPDNPNTFVAQSNVAGNNGTFSIDANGNWSYTANSAFDSLNVGDSVSDSFSVASSDGTTTTVDVIINGTNDAATLSSATVSLTESDAPITSCGTLTNSDPDNPNTFVAQSDVTGDNGTFSVDSQGNWTYTANSAFNNLAVGDSVNDSFTVTSSDGTTTSVQVTINGSNDAPVTSVDVVGDITESGIFENAYNLLLNDSDVEGDSFSVSEFAQDANGTSAAAADGSNSITTSLGGTVVMNANGTFRYTSPANADHTENDTLVDTFYYKASDGSDASDWTQVSINVNDSAPTAVNDNDVVTEGGHVFGNVITGLGGDGTGADSLGADATELTSVTFDGVTYDNFENGSLTINADNGVLVINQDGNYHYESSPNADNTLSAGGSKYISSWTDAGIDVTGHAMGVPIFGEEIEVSDGNKGLHIDSPGGQDSQSKLDSLSSTETETIVLNMNGNYTSLDLDLKDINYQDQIQWKAYDSEQNLVDSGIIANSDKGSGSHKEASFTIEPAEAFQYLAIQGSDDDDGFSIWGISNAVAVISGADVFAYTIKDADDDVSTAQLSITHEESNAITANVDISSVDEADLSDPHNDVITSGNILNNDTNLSETSYISQVSFGENTEQAENGVITIESDLGTLTVYTTTTNEHDAGDYTYTLQSTGNAADETFTYEITDSATSEVSESALIINIANDPDAIDEQEDINAQNDDNEIDNLAELAENDESDDTLFGGLGPDVLTANEDGSVIVGGPGDDTATGGSGSDRFVWNVGDDSGGATDTIIDFVHGANGDVLDLSNLLESATADAEELDSYLNITYQEGANGETGDSVIEVNATGEEGAAATQTIVLAGVDLTQGGALSGQDIITDMLNNGNLVIDG